MADTTLDGSIGAGDTDITVGDAFVADADFLIQIENEFLLVERRGTSVNPQVRRGMFGTTAASHANASDVSVVVVQVQTDAPVDPPASTDGHALADLASVLAEGSDGDGGTITNVASLDADAITVGGDPVLVTVAAYVDPASQTFAADLITSLIAAGLMAAA